MNKISWCLTGVFKNGYGTIPKQPLQDNNLTQIAKLIYSYFCSYAGGKEEVFPGYKTICNDLDISKDTLFFHLKYLYGYGYITKSKKKKSNANTYLLNQNPVKNQKYLDEIEKELMKRKKQSKTIENKVKFKKVSNLKKYNNVNKINDSVPVSSEHSVPVSSEANIIIYNNPLITTTTTGKKNKKSVVVAENSLNDFIKKFKDKYGIELHKGKMEDLYREIGKEKIEEYYKNFDKFIDSQKEIRDLGAYFYKAVMESWSIPIGYKKPDAINSSAGINNRQNYSQRDIDSIDFNVYENFK